MTFMHILVVELLCQAAMGWIPTLKCLLPGTRGSQWLRLVLSGVKWPHHPRTLVVGSLARYRRPHGMASGGLGAC
jgi:hypothetical protein